MNKKLISFTVLLITALLATITCVYAWFVTNTEANATGISIRTSDVAITGGNLSRYIAIYDEASNTYSYDEQNGNIDSWSSNTYPASFDNLNDYDKIIYKLGFKVNKDSYSISFTRNDSSVSSIISTSNNVSTNFLSNIASFSLLSQNSDSTLSLVNFSDGTSENNIISVIGKNTSNKSFGKRLIGTIGDIELIKDFDDSLILYEFEAKKDADHKDQI